MHMDFGKFIKDLRRKKGLSLQDVSKSTGVSISYYSRVENGLKPPFSGRKEKNRKLYFKLGEILGVDGSFLQSLAKEKLAKKDSNFSKTENTDFAEKNFVQKELEKLPFFESLECAESLVSASRVVDRLKKENFSKEVKRVLEDYEILRALDIFFGMILVSRENHRKKKFLYYPFHPLFTFGNKRSGIFSDFTNEQILFLKQNLSKYKNPIITARLYDILWSLEKQKKYAEMAIDLYLEKFKIYLSKIEEIKARALLKNEASVKENDTNYDLLHLQGDICSEIIRVCELWIQIGGDDKERKSKIISSINQCLQKLYDYNEKDRRNYSDVRILKAFVNINGSVKNFLDRDNYSFLIKFVKKQIKDLESFENYDKADSYYEILLKLENFSETSGKSETAFAKAEACFKDLELKKKQAQKGTWLTPYYEKAILEYKNLKQTESVKKKIKILTEEKMEISKKKLGSIKIKKTFSTDATAMVKSLKESLDNLPSQKERVLFLASLANPNPLNLYKESARETIQSNPMFSFINHVKGNERGGTEYVFGSKSDDPIDFTIYTSLQFELPLRGNFILLGLDHILNKGDVDLKIFDEILKNRDLIPEDRVSLFKDGFKHGLHLEWNASIRILVLELENSIRYILERKKNYSSSQSFNVNGHCVNEDESLSFLLNLQQSKELFGEDYIYHMKFLFSERGGYNFKNKISHGHIGDINKDSISPFIWAFILNLIIKDLNE